jgi:hypothetical protein
MRLRADFQQQRQEEAIERQELSGAMTPEQRLKALDERLGVGVGAVRERARLQAKLGPKAEPKAPKKVKKAKAE